MSQTITEKGKTIDEAVQKALTRLSAEKDQVDIHVVQEPEVGFIGLFGKKEAIVEVTLKESFDPEKQAEAYVEDEADKVQKLASSFLSDMFQAMQLDVEIQTSYETEDDVLNIELSGDKMGLLIGRRGQTLDAIQYLTSLAVNKKTDHHVRVCINTEHYREKRQQTLENLANKMANKVARSHRKFSLEPMNPGERRIIHATLQDDKRVYTYSEGQDPYRYVVIDLKENDQE
ncbi:MAG: RNA-binding cell elongation regulator Jag/EloR [Pseudoramibacter sp.]